MISRLSFESKEDNSDSQDDVKISFSADDEKQALLTVPDNSLSSLATDSDSDSVDIVPDHYDSCCEFAKPFRPLLNLGPLAVAITGTADVARSLWKAKNTSLPIIITTSSAEFISSFGLTGETTRENFNETCTIFKRREFPNDWPKLSRMQEGFAIAITLVPAAFAPISEGMQAYFFVDELPLEYNLTNINLTGWAVLSGLIAGGAGLTTLLTDSMEMYKLVRERLAGTHTPYKNTFSRIASPLIGGTLGALDAAQKSIQSYIAIKTIFNVDTLTGRICVGIPSMLNAIPFFCFSGMFSINAMDDFFGEKNPCKPKKILAMTFSVSIAVFLAFFKRALNKSFYQDVTSDFGGDPKSIPWAVYESLSWAMFVQESIQTTAVLYTPMYNLMSKIQNGLSYAGDLCTYIFSSCCKSSETAEHHPDDFNVLVENESDSFSDLFSDDTSSLLDNNEIKPVRLIINEYKVSSYPGSFFPSPDHTPETSDAENEYTAEEVIDNDLESNNNCLLM